MIIPDFTCAFTGHRPAALERYGISSDQLCELLEDAVQSAADEGFTDFLCGASRGADMIFADAVLKVREERKIRLHCILPCKTQADNWSYGDRSRYSDLLDSADSVICLSESYFNGCMQARNRYMVDRSALLIAAYSGSDGGTAYTVEYAARHGVRTVNVLMQDKAPRQLTLF